MPAKSDPAELGDVEPLADSTARQARRVVAAYATDADECRVFLSMLGIGPRSSRRKWLRGAAKRPAPGVRTSSWWPIGCPSTWSGCPTAARRGSAAPAAWSPRWNRCCADAAAPGSAGRAYPTPMTTRSSEDGMYLCPVRLSADDVSQLLRGLLQRHAVAAVPRRHRQADLPPPVVGRLRRGQPALRRGHREGGGRGRDGVGAGLSAAAGARRCCGCCGPI